MLYSTLKLGFVMYLLFVVVVVSFPARRRDVSLTTHVTPQQSAPRVA